MAERRGNQTVTTGQQRAFISHLASSANVTASAQVAGFDRSTAYYMRQNEPEFADAWDDAIEQSTDTLMAEARRRAIQGVQEPVVSMGRIVMIEGQALQLTKYSDTLMALLLKAHRPAMFNPAAPSVASQAVPDDLLPDPEPTPDEPGPSDPIA